MVWLRLLRSIGAAGASGVGHGGKWSVGKAGMWRGVGVFVVGFRAEVDR
jgi:hypothetical protein